MLRGYFGRVSVATSQCALVFEAHCRNICRRPRLMPIGRFCATWPRSSAHSTMRSMRRMRRCLVSATLRAIRPSGGEISRFRLSLRPPGSIFRRTRFAIWRALKDEAASASGRLCSRSANASSSGAMTSRPPCGASRRGGHDVGRGRQGRALRHPLRACGDLCRCGRRGASGRAVSPGLDRGRDALQGQAARVRSGPSTEATARSHASLPTAPIAP